MTDEVVPSHNLQAEESLLGAMLLSRDATEAAVEICTAADFYRPVHGHIFDAVAVLHSRGDPVDAVTVADELERSGLLEPVGGLAALLSLQAHTPATSNAGRYARIVEEHALLRRLNAAAREMAELAATPGMNAGDALLKAGDLLEGLASRSTVLSRPRRFTVARDEWADAYDATGAMGVPTGWLDLDAVFTGFRPGLYAILGGRPSTGKSSLSMALAWNVARRGRPVLVFSLEMAEPELVDRSVASLAGLPLDKVVRRDLSDDAFRRALTVTDNLADAPLWVLHRRRAGVRDIRTAARRVISESSTLDLLIVDFLQLVHHAGKAETKEQEVAAVSGQLRELAGELGCSVLALSSLRRLSGAAPQLEDLRSSGQLESDADLVLLLARPDTTNPDTSRRGEIDLIIAKQRNGPVGTVALRYDPRNGRFRDIPREDSAEPLSMNYDGEGSR